jgi:hypothetical protein
MFRGLGTRKEIGSEGVPRLPVNVDTGVERSSKMWGMMRMSNA